MFLQEAGEISILAVAMRGRSGELVHEWRRRESNPGQSVDHLLGFERERREIVDILRGNRSTAEFNVPIEAREIVE